MATASSDLFAPAEPQLTVLSYGAGQDSTVLLDMLLYDPKFRATYAPRDLLVIQSDTGDELPETYALVERMKARCEAAGVPFVFLTADMGFHSSSWLSLRHFYRTFGTIGSKAFPKTCSARLKIDPIYRYLEKWLSDTYGVRNHNKAGFREFAARFGRIQMMIGFAKGEQTRTSDSSTDGRRWYRESINTIYPLIDMGMDREACQEYLHSKGLRVMPSNCLCCPFLSLEELEYQRRFFPEELSDWVELEAAKLKKNKHKENVIVTDKEGRPVLKRDGTVKTANKNYGVFGVKPLPVKIAEAKAKFSEWSDAEITHYRYSHGHCVTTRY